MDAYLEIRLLPDPEFAQNLLLNALFAKLHRGLVEHGAGDIGVSFPDHGGKGLGGRLRLHGACQVLEGFMATGWLTGMRDHVVVGKLTAVPDHARHRVVRRVQAKSSPERLRRRRMARQGVGAEEARQAIPDCAAEMLRLPFLTLNSRSTSQQFRLFVEHLPEQNQAVAGSFSAYGLSPTATVPWF